MSRGVVVESRQIVGHPVVEGQLALVYQQQDGGADHRLGHGADVVEGVNLQGSLTFLIVPAKGFVQQHLTVFDDGQLCADDLTIGHEVLHDLCKLGQCLGIDFLDLICDLPRSRLRSWLLSWRNSRYRSHRWDSRFGWDDRRLSVC